MNRTHFVARFAARAMLVVGAICLVPTVASAEPRQSVGDLQQRARSIADQIDQLNVRSDRLDEQYNAARLELSDLEARLAENEAAVVRARSQVTDGRRQAQHYAIGAYVSGGSVGEALVPAADSAGTSRRRVYLSVLQGDKQQVLDDLGAAQQSLDETEKELNASRASVKATTDALASTRKDLEGSIAHQQQLLDSTKGQLSTALAQEQARRVQEAASRAAAQLARQVAADAARRPSPTTTSRSRVTASASASRSTPERERVQLVADPAPAPAFDPGPVSGAAGAAIAAARTQLGVPYRWGAASPGSGFDCSGLVMWAYGQAGRSLPHSSRALYSMTRRLSAGDLQPGDLVFGGSPVHHVGIYVGGGMMIHAPHSGDVVRIASMYSTSKPVSFGRL